MNQDYIQFGFIMLKMIAAGAALTAGAALLAKLDEKFGWNLL